ncbi:hypothetical protein LCGC14_0380630 [marine sediment metagenome]|uniref:Helicase HerA central domain-containing protein n=1 Tax=marine sediment metagenome TaxID=412755 RepID=A0A0F9TKN2_9ZZZZ
MTDLKIVYDVNTKKDVPINLQEIIKSRVLLQANSGGGKSHWIRKLNEESHGKVQLILLDPEGEFHTLREKYEFLLVAKGPAADIQADVKHAPLLAKKLMETSANTIIDLYELNPFERIRFVKAFFNAMVNLPKNLWHPCIIILDEAHVFAPEKTHAESLEAVADMASRGRKRGYALVCATQRISKFNKDVAAELNTKFIGRCSLDNDRKRAAEELGIKDSTVLRKLKHEFYAFGPAISEDTIKVKAYETKSMHEEIGSIREYTPVNKSKIQGLMKNFAELPKEAANEMKTIQDCKLKITELTVENRKLKAGQPKEDPKAIEKAYTTGYNKAINDAKNKFEEAIKNHAIYVRQNKANRQMLKELAVRLQATLDQDNEFIKGNVDPVLHLDLKKFLTPPGLSKPGTSGSLPVKHTLYSKPLELTSRAIPFTEDGKLGRCETQILIALAQRGKSSSKQQIAIIAGYSFKSGGFSNSISRLKSLALIAGNGDGLQLTDLGMDNVKDYEPIPATTQDLLNFWMTKLGKCPAAILKVICENPGDHTKDSLAEATNYSANSGGFSNSVSKLVSLGLMNRLYDGLYSVSKEMLGND